MMYGKAWYLYGTMLYFFLFLKRATATATAIKPCSDKQYPASLANHSPSALDSTETCHMA